MGRCSLVFLEREPLRCQLRLVIMAKFAFNNLDALVERLESATALFPLQPFVSDRTL